MNFVKKYGAYDSRAAPLRRSAASRSVGERSDPNVSVYISVSIVGNRNCFDFNEPELGRILKTRTKPFFEVAAIELTTTMMLVSSITNPTIF